MVGLALVYSSFLTPLKKMIKPLRNPVFIAQQRGKLRASVALIVLLLAGLIWLPVPESRVLRGVVEARDNTALFAQSAAQVRQVHVSNGQWVRAGSLLIEMENTELAQELRAAQAQLGQVWAQERKALAEASVDLRPIQEKLRALQQTIDHLNQQIDDLMVYGQDRGRAGPALCGGQPDRGAALPKGPALSGPDPAGRRRSGRFRPGPKRAQGGGTVFSFARPPRHGCAAASDRCIAQRPLRLDSG